MGWWYVCISLGNQKDCFVLMLQQTAWSEAYRRMLLLILSIWMLKLGHGWIKCLQLGIHRLKLCVVHLSTSMMTKFMMILWKMTRMILLMLWSGSTGTGRQILMLTSLWGVNQSVSLTTMHNVLIYEMIFLIAPILSVAPLTSLVLPFLVSILSS